MMKMAEITFRFATRDDCALIFSFIHELAVYERMEDEVVATAEMLAEWLFDKNTAEVIFALVDGKEVGFALFFTNFSTFLGRAGLYLEDIFVKPAYRRQGIGTAFFKKLADITVERGYGRFEWACLDWNTPSIDFFTKMGAKPMKEWTTYRLS
jgi:GNAT superfamily N-acetyltransferase